MFNNIELIKMSLPFTIHAPASFESHGVVKITGIQGALLELGLFFLCASALRIYFDIKMHYVPFYWLSFTVLTGIWELTYVSCKSEVSDMAEDLLRQGEHVWNKTYNLRMILPHNLAKVFYAEYAAYADRLYMCAEGSWNKWSIFVEGTHCALCGFSAFLMFFAYIVLDNTELFNQFLVQSMSFQMMNSVLYMSMYSIQMQDPNSTNYVTDKFPKKGRTFMLINIFWTLMPMLILLGMILF